MERSEIRSNTFRSIYTWSYLLSSKTGRSVRKTCTFNAKRDKYGIPTHTAMGTYLLHPHLGPPTVLV